MFFTTKNILPLPFFASSGDGHSVSFIFGSNPGEISSLHFLQRRGEKIPAGIPASHCGLPSIVRTIRKSADWWGNVHLFRLEDEALSLVHRTIALPNREGLTGSDVLLGEGDYNSASLSRFAFSRIRKLFCFVVGNVGHSSSSLPRIEAGSFPSGSSVVSRLASSMSRSLSAILAPSVFHPFLSAPRVP
jgi:hypothetical protein